MKTKKDFVVIRAGWDPMPDPNHKHHKWIDCEELIHLYGLEDKQDLLITWRKRTDVMTLPPLERCVVLGPKMFWDYVLPDNIEEMLRNRLKWNMQRAVDKAWKNTKGGKVAVVNGVEREVAHA